MTVVRQDRLRVAMAGLALLGIAIAGYLTWVHYAGLKPVCLSGGGGCEKVQSSQYADVAGIPVALRKSAASSDPSGCAARRASRWGCCSR